MNPIFSDPAARINQFTAGNDRSDSPEMRQTAQQYAQACADLNLLLAEFRDLLEHGRSREALERAAALQPSLTERAEALRLAAPQIFLEAAADYGWELPPEPDRDTLRHLASVAEELPRLQPLLAQWRGAARSADDAAKIVLLRQLIAADPEHSRDWKENLLTVERRHLSRLLQQAEEPSLSREALQKIAGELLSPQLCRPPDPRTLRPILDRLRALQETARKQRAEELLSRIAAADGAADFPALAEALEAYDRLAGDPDFTALPEAAEQLAAARHALQTHREKEAARQTAADLTAALEDALDRQRPTSEVERLFRKLQSLSEELPATLADRTHGYLETVHFQENRRHFRTLFIAAAAVLLLAVLGIAGGLLYARERAYRDACRQYERELTEAGPQALLTALDELAHTAPRLAARSGIKALRAKAERRLAEITADAAEFDRLAEALEKLDPDGLTGQAAGSDLQKAGTLVTAADQPRRERLERLQRKRADELKKRADAAYELLVAHGTAWQQRLQELLAAPGAPGAEKRLAGLADELAALRKETGKQSPDPAKCNALLDQLESQWNAARSQVRRMQERQALLERLQNPKDFAEYAAALAEAEPDPEYARQFKSALARAEFWRHLEALQFQPESWESDEDAGRLTALLPYLKGSVAGDLAALLPEGKNAGKMLLAEYRKEIEDFYRTFSTPEYQVRMLALTGSDGLPCRFYANQPLTLERSGRRIKGAEIPVFAAPGGRISNVTFGISGNQIYVTQELVVDGFRLPSEYTLPEGVARFPENLVEPPHLALKEAIAAELRSAASPQAALAVLEDAFRKLARTPELEPVIRRRMTAKLLEIAALLFPLADREIREAAALLPEDGMPFANWCDPSLIRREPEAWRQYQEKLQQADGAALIARLRLRRELLIRLVSRDLVPFGVLRKTADGKWDCHEFPRRGAPQEVWIVDPDDDGGLFKIVGRVKAGKMHLAAAAEPFFREGTVLWTPLAEPDTGALLQELRERKEDPLFLGSWLPADFTGGPAAPEAAP